MQCGQLQIAWDLFKGALELHLAHEKYRVNPNGGLSKMAKNFISRAYDRYNEFISSQKNDDEKMTPFVVTGGHGEDESFCHFFLFRDPIKIPDDFLEDPIKSYLPGLIIILNMAILEDYKNASSTQALSLYQLAASLLSGSSAEVQYELIIMNNLAVWHQHSGDVSVAEKYMRRVALIAYKFPSDPCFTPVVWDGIAFNLQWFAAPRFKISPAA